MDAVQSALWYVESHLGQPISLDEVARASGASTYHLTRAFAAVFGLPLMRYVRRRRLSEAARLIAAGAAEILPVALQDVEKPLGTEPFVVRRTSSPSEFARVSRRTGSPSYDLVAESARMVSKINTP